LTPPLAFFASVYVVLSLYLDTTTALLISTLSSILEAFRLPIDDNFVIPVFVSALYYLTW